MVLNTWDSTIEIFANGTITEVARGQYAIPNVVTQPVGDYQSTCQYTSTTNPDGSLTLIGSCSGETLSGIGKGEKTTLAPSTWRLVASQGVILMSAIGTEVSTLTSDLAGVFKRICQGRATGVK